MKYLIFYLFILNFTVFGGFEDSVYNNSLPFFGTKSPVLTNHNRFIAATVGGSIAGAALIALHAKRHSLPVYLSRFKSGVAKIPQRAKSIILRKPNQIKKISDSVMLQEKKSIDMRHADFEIQQQLKDAKDNFVKLKHDINNQEISILTARLIKGEPLLGESVLSSLKNKLKVDESTLEELGESAYRSSKKLADELCIIDKAKQQLAELQTSRTDHYKNFFKKHAGSVSEKIVHGKIILVFATLSTVFNEGLHYIKDKLKSTFSADDANFDSVNSDNVVSGDINATNGLVLSDDSDDDEKDAKKHIFSKDEQGNNLKLDVPLILPTDIYFKLLHKPTQSNIVFSSDKSIDAIDKNISINSTMDNSLWSKIKKIKNWLW